MMHLASTLAFIKPNLGFEGIPDAVFCAIFRSNFTEIPFSRYFCLMNE